MAHTIVTSQRTTSNLIFNNLKLNENLKIIYRFLR